MRLFLDPIFLLILLVVLAYYLHKRNRKKLSRYIFLLSGLWLFVISVSPIPQYLIYRLEYSYPAFDMSMVDSTKQTHIIVLGGGSYISPEMDASHQLSGASKARMVEGMRIYHQIPNSRIVFSGYSSSGRTSVAELMALSAVSLKISPADTLMMVNSANTKQEAKFYNQRFAQDYQLVLVTSASHMPRAMQNFQKLKMAPISAPTDFNIRIDPKKNTFHFKPSIKKISLMKTAIKEYVGGFLLTVVE